MIRGVRNIQTIGLESITIYDSKPFFFVFADIDTKDESFLLKVLTYFKFRHLSVYYYETNHGFHVISPCMLKFRKWTNVIEGLRQLLPDYRFNAIRCSTRNDFNYARFENWNDRYSESVTLHNLITNRFKMFDNPLIKKGKNSELSFIKYNQLIYP